MSTEHVVGRTSSEPSPNHGLDALSMLTVYMVLLLAIPSYLIVTPLGSLGKPAFLWGLLLAVWWALHQLQARSMPVESPHQPVRFAFVVLIVIALVSFAAAMLRGQPFDQVSPAQSGLLRLVSWGGVLFVVLDGIQNLRDLMTLVRRFVLAVSLVAFLGLLQFATRQSLVDRLTIPGMSASEVGGAQVRGGFIRAASTATHPLEYGTLLSLGLPLALAYGSGLGGARRVSPAIWRWAPTAIISVAALVSTSRSAVLGFAVGIIVTVPGLPRRLRRTIVACGTVLVGFVLVAVPGMFATMRQLFTGVSSDPSAQSRSGALAKAPGFIAASPIFGTGFGTFLPRYYIFDNEWVLLTIELGVVGVIAFAALVGTAAWSALWARRISGATDVQVLGQALAASVLAGVVTLAGFDGLSFPISAGALFICIGMCGALRTSVLVDQADELPISTLALASRSWPAAPTQRRDPMS